MARIIEMLPGEKVLFSNSQWEVTNMHVQCPEEDYFFEIERIADCNAKDGYGWPCHMAGKRWVNIDAFCEAWLVALAQEGRKIPNADAIVMRAKAKALEREANEAARREAAGEPRANHWLTRDQQLALPDEEE